MIKRCFKLFSFVLLSALALLSVNFVGENLNTANAVITVPDGKNEFFQNFTFTSENMVYGQSNFLLDNELKEILPITEAVKDYTYLGALYANTNITIHINQDFIESKEIEDLHISTTKDYVYSTSEEKYIQSVSFNSVVDSSATDYYVLKMNYDSPKIQLLTYTYSYVIEERDADGILVAKENVKRNFTMYIIQQTMNFTRSNPVKYSYKDTFGVHNVSAMKTGASYPVVNIKVPFGSILNPIYVNFIKNGESYTIYNIEGKFYNDLVGTNAKSATNELTVLNEMNEDTSFNPENTSVSILPLVQSGIYEIKIYDRAYLYTNSNKTLGLVNPNSNLITDSFLIGADLYGVYLTAQSSSGIQIADKQPTNEDVTVKFYNVSTYNIDKIIISYYNWITLENKSTTLTRFNLADTTHENYKKKKYTSFELDRDFTFILNGDYLYTFKIVYSEDVNTIKDSNDELMYQDFEYQIPIVKGIYTNFTTHNEHLSADGQNKVTTKTVYQPMILEYNYGITSNYTHEYNVRLANSNPTISGIANGGSKDGDVVLTISGVGKIIVNITGATTIKNKEVQNGEKITLSNSGDYKITILDSVGGYAEKTFSIGVKMNMASIALIVVGVLLVAGIVFFIMKNRGKVSVK